MNNPMDRIRCARLARRALATAVLGLSLGALGACDSLLEVDLPAKLTDVALEDPAGVLTQVNSIIANFEIAYNNYVWEAFGREDGGEIQLSSPGTEAGNFTYGVEAAWFSDFMVSHRFGEYLHGKLTNDWTVAQVPLRGQYLALSSIYQGAAIGLMGQTLCEVAVRSGPLLTAAQALARADSLLTRALAEINATGDFALPSGVSTSARNMALGLRAQVRWMAGDNAGALADAAQVPPSFVAWVTRDATPARRNKPFYAGTLVRWAELYGVIDWWNGLPNPETGQAWGTPIPFTGYQTLGILPDGRAVRDDGVPIRTAGPHRTPAEDNAVADNRVQAVRRLLQGGSVESWVNARYDGEGANIPLVTGKEMLLIRAEIVGGQGAIDLVNQLRTTAGLPLVTYANPNNADQIRKMIIEERRRALYLEGRFFMTKLRNPDLLWFPRSTGSTLRSRFQLRGGVRFLMPDNEFLLNPNLSLSDRATGCPASQRPVNF